MTGFLKINANGQSDPLIMLPLHVY